MLGREVLLPATLIAAPPEEPITTSISYVERFQNDMRDAHARVRQTTHNVAKTQKASFDKTVKGPTFSVGQQVWLYWPKPLLRQQRKKLVKLWYGPYTIVELKSNIVVVIRHNHTHKKQTVHVDRLIPCRLLPQTTPLGPPSSSITPTPTPTTRHVSRSTSGYSLQQQQRRSSRQRRIPVYLTDYVEHQ